MTSAPGSSRPSSAWGFGLATIDSKKTVLDVWFPQPALGSAPDDVQAESALKALAASDHSRGVRREVRLVEIADLQSAPPTWRCRAWW